ncbi:MAG: M48 family metallopeptidase [Myxococcota bacterium]
MQPVNQQQGFDTSNSKMLREILIILSALVLIVMLVLWLISNVASWAVSAVPTSVDTMLGESAATDYINDANRCTNPALDEYLSQLTKPLLAEFGEQPYTFQFSVIDEEVPNAFALPGGFVAIHSGLIDSASTGEEIAGVLAHEIAHVTHRHGMKRILRSAGVAVAVGYIFGSTDLALLADYASELGSLSYDRDEEREADETAREILAAAKIDPRGMAIFFAKLLEEEGDSGWAAGFLSTHPDLKERIEDSLNAPVPTGRRTELPKPTGLPCHTKESNNE